MKTRRMDLSLDHYDALREKNDALRAENAKLRVLVSDLVEYLDPFLDNDDKNQISAIRTVELAYLALDAQKRGTED